MRAPRVRHGGAGRGHAGFGHGTHSNKLIAISGWAKLIRCMTGRRAQDLTDADRIDRLRLIRSDNIGPRTFRSLLRHFGDARRRWSGCPIWRDAAARGGRAAFAAMTMPAPSSRRAERLASALVAPGETAYPPRLTTLDDAPPLLGVRGALDVLMRPMIAIVGSRNASGAGLKFAGQLARDLGDAGFVVISGLARGIDQAAHRATSQSGTVAVLAGGHDRIYPPEHEDLLRLARTWRRHFGNAARPCGARSGFSAAQPPDLGRGAWRRRGGSRHRSGSLITARMAAEQGREVFAVPGSPLDPRAAGTNDLIKQGATLITEAADVINAVEPIMERPITPAARGRWRAARVRTGCDRTRTHRRSARTEPDQPRRPDPDVGRLAGGRANRVARARARRTAGAPWRRTGVADLVVCLNPFS